ncbi:uncharacterized protein [Antedon mediterranea]|uniref:uncharacterized protein isoform X2 n=1 Tax=Antedon mediterranea TaxID=105859 RepID=UPI003AF59272
MANNEKFMKLKLQFSKFFESHKYKWLRFCLFDHLPFGDLTAADSGTQLLNSLEDRGHIRHNNVHLLLEISKLSCLTKAEECVTEYMLDGNNNTNTQNKVTRKLSKYRKSLFNALREVGNDELSEIKGYYNLSNDYQTIWDLLLRLERDRSLEDDSNKIERFANCLNPTAKNHLLGICVKIPISIKRKADDSEDELSQKRHRLEHEDILAKCQDREQKLLFYFLRCGCGKGFEIIEGSIVFHVSIVDPRALTNLWRLHQNGQLLKDVAEILFFKEKHRQDFEVTWETQFDQQIYIAALEKLNQKEHTYLIPTITQKDTDISQKKNPAEVAIPRQSDATLRRHTMPAARSDRQWSISERLDQLDLTGN